MSDITTTTHQPGQVVEVQDCDFPNVWERAQIKSVRSDRYAVRYLDRGYAQGTIVPASRVRTRR